MRRSLEPPGPSTWLTLGSLLGGLFVLVGTLLVYEGSYRPTSSLPFRDSMGTTLEPSPPTSPPMVLHAVLELPTPGPTATAAPEPAGLPTLPGPPAPPTCREGLAYGTLCSQPRPSPTPTPTPAPCLRETAVKALCLWEPTAVPGSSPVFAPASSAPPPTSAPMPGVIG